MESEPFGCFTQQKFGVSLNPIYYEGDNFFSSLQFLQKLQKSAKSCVVFENYGFYKNRLKSEFYKKKKLTIANSKVVSILIYPSHKALVLYRYYEVKLSTSYNLMPW